MHALQQVAELASLTAKEQVSIREWLVEQLVAQEHAKLEQGGHTRNQIPLRRVFVDLPVCDSPITEYENDSRCAFLERLLAAPPVKLRTSSNQDPTKEGRSLFYKFGRSPRQVRALKENAGETYSANLLIGGPGQGKSTLGQIASQIHRAVLLRPIADELTYLQRTLVNSFEPDQTKKQKKLWPNTPFLPIQVSLPDLSTWLAKEVFSPDVAPPAILRFVCELPSSKAAGLNTLTLWKTVQHIPLLLIFDGFDEVGASEDRKRIVAAIREFIFALGNERANVQIIATTRPQGYAGELEHIGIPLSEHYLVPLLKNEALEYATKLLEAKIGGADEREKMLNRLKEASADSATARLLTTPLQVTILAALVQQIGRAPRERWNLFYRYFSYTYDREIERETYASALLATFRPQIEQIHARVGLLLQVEAERAGGASARMQKQKLLEVIDAVLSEDEFEDKERERLTFEIAIAAGNRLVFLVEPEPNAFGFEIRSLQEFMAGWAISSGRDTDVEARVRLLAGSSIFRNVMLFVASRFYSEASSLRDVISDHVCAELDASSDDATRLTRTGALLALEILEEGAVLSQPKRARALMTRAVKLLELPAARIHTRLAIAVSQDTASILFEAIEEQLERSTIEAENFASWVCLCELINRANQTAIEIGERHWHRIISLSTMLAELRANSVSFGDWLLAKMESRASEIKPTMLYGLRNPGKNAPVAVSWAKWFSYISHELFRMDRGFLNSTYINDEDKTLPSCPGYAPPDAWLPYVHLVRFEVQPSSEKLATVLDSFATSGTEDWRDLYWNTSWPLKCAIVGAETVADLRKFALLAKQGMLGEVEQWRECQRGWTISQFELVLPESSDFLPWHIDRLPKAPPLLSLAPWLFSEQVLPSSMNIFDQLSRMFAGSKSGPKRRWLALSTLFASRELKSIQGGELNFIIQVVNEMPELLGVLLPKPKGLKSSDWYRLLDKCDAIDSGWLSCPENVFKGTKKRTQIHPVLLKLSVFSIDKHSMEFTDDDDSASVQMRTLLEKVSARNEKEEIYIEILRLYAGSLSPERDSWIVNAAVLHSDEKLNLVKQVVYALHNRQISETRQIGILIQALRFAKSDYSLTKDIIEILRTCLGSRKTGMDSTAKWNSMGFAAPAPSGLSYNALARGLPSEPIWFQNLELKGVGRFEQIQFAFSQPLPEEGQWIVILGQNGAGKSTLLRSIAIALRNVKDPSIWPPKTFAREWIRVTLESETTENTQIRLTMGDGNTHLTDIRPGTPMSFSQTPEHQVPRQVPLFAYGCRRGSALGGVNREVDLGDGMEIATLVDESASLIHAETWLKDLEGDASSRQVFDAIIGALQQLLNVERIWVEKRRVWVIEGEGPAIGFSELSDGYLTSAGWFVDLVARWVEMAEKAGIRIEREFLRSMTGVVLIDEIDLHLHPKWQIEIIGRTRKLLPKMSFVVTTHNPLTLVGAKAHEIWVLGAGRNAGSATQGIGSPILLTGGQLFRRYFGIQDVYPAALGRAVQRLSFLAGMDDLSLSEKNEISELKATVASAGVPLEWIESDTQSVDKAKEEQ